MGDIIKFEKRRDPLTGICLRGISHLYGAACHSETEERLHEEMQSLSLIRGGKQAFLDAVEFAGKMRNLCSGIGRGYEPIVTFRGSALSSLIAYLTGITDNDPLSLGLDPWFFYEKQSVIEFSFNLPVRAICIIDDYDLRIPGSVRLYCGRDASMIEAVMQSGVSDLKSAPVLPEREALLEENDEIKDFFNEFIMGKRDHLKYVISYDSKYVPHVFEVLDYLCEIDRLPTCLEELAKLDAFLHCTLTTGNFTDELRSAWECSTDGNIYDSMIAFADDVYGALIDGGCEEWRAKNITRNVKCFSRQLSSEDRYFLEYYCGCDFLLRVSRIKHLYCRSQCLQSALLGSRLMYLTNHHPEAVRDAYESICSYYR